MNQNRELLQTLARCAAACEMCSDACLDEQDIQKMVPCIRLDRDCAKLCHVASSLVASRSKNAGAILKVLADVCKACGDECSKHEMDHCQECARACRECEQACRSYAGAA